MVLRYLDNAKDDIYYIGKILNDLKIIVKNTNGIEKTRSKNRIDVM